MSIAIYVLEEAARAPSGSRATGGLPVGRRLRLVAAAGWMAVGAVLTGVAGWTLRGAAGPLKPAVPHDWPWSQSAQQPLAFHGINTDIDISPDGTEVAYRSGSATQWQLVVRPLNGTEPRPLGQRDGRKPAVLLPDGQWIGFSSGAQLKKVALSGGPAVVLCRIAGAPSLRGAHWGPNDTIVFADGDPATGLLSVPASGGEPKVPARHPMPQRVRATTGFHSVLPNGHGVLFTIANERPDSAQIARTRLRTGQRKTLINGGSDAKYVGSGHLVYVAAGTLRAVRLQPDHTRRVERSGTRRGPRDGGSRWSRELCGVAERHVDLCRERHRGADLAVAVARLGGPAGQGGADSRPSARVCQPPCFTRRHSHSR